MNAVAPRIEDKIDELLTVLDKDIENLQHTLKYLDELRSLVIKRDDVSLGKLLESIKADSDSFTAHESKRNLIRKELAAALDCEVGQLTLSALEEILPQEKSDQINSRKKSLKSLIEKLKTEHTGTVMLLSDCARFNSLLLRSIFNLGRSETITYSSNGAAKRQNDTTFVNLQF